MGLIYTKVTFSNAKKPDLKPVEVSALVDTGALFTCIPEHIAVQLGLEELQKREVTLADGKSQIVPYVGPLMIGFENRLCFTGALILGNEALLGATALEDLDVLISPIERKLIINPESPNIAHCLAK
ncbi:MAG: clan AA aspartic protease [Chitinivibrionales bacterium]|nr:clan AA aspartic protease [Chitinivibrionales bacterium]